MKWIAALLLLAACASGGIREPERAGGQNVMRVSAVWPSIEVKEPLSPETWRASLWYCHEPLTTPAMVIISDQWACILDELIVDVPLVGDYYKCPHRWVGPSHAC